MITLPDIFTDYKGRGPKFAGLLTIHPRSGDTWTEKRYGTKSLYVDGDEFLTGYIKSISPISNKADLVSGGAADLSDAITVRLANKDGTLADTFGAEPVNGRKVTLDIGCCSFNKILNAGFEDYTGAPADFDYWTESSPGAGGFILYASAYKHSGSGCCLMGYGGTLPTPSVTSNTFTFKTGEWNSGSFWAYSINAGDFVRVYLNIGGLWWNFGTRSLQIGTTYLDCTPAAATTWEKFSFNVGWHELNFSGQVDKNAYLIFEVPTNGDQVAIDSVQFEANKVETPFHYHNQNLTSSDVQRRFTGTIKEPFWDDNEIELQIEGYQSDQHREIPIGIINEESLPSPIVIPRDNHGKPFPMTYGGFELFDTWTYYGQQPVPEGELAIGYLCDEVSPLIHFDRPDIKIYSITSVAYYDKKSNYYYKELWDDKTTPTYVAYEWAKTPNNSKAYIDPAAHHLLEKRAPFMAWIRGSYHLNVSGPTNPARAYDGYCNQAAGGPWDAKYTGLSVGTMNVRLKPHELSHVLCLDAFILIDIENVDVLADGSGTPAYTVWFRNLPGTYNSGAITVPCAKDGSYFNVPWGRDFAIPANQKQMATSFNLAANSRLNALRNITDEMVLRISMDHSGMTGTQIEARLYEVGVRVDFTVDMMKADYCAILAGREFQDSWGTRRTAGNPIDYAPDVVESILRDELGAATADINTTAFDAALADILGGTAFVMSGQLIEFENSEDVIDKICYEAHMLYYIDWDGKHAVKLLEYDASDKVATIFEDDFEKGSIKCGYTPFDQCFNDIRIRYRKNRITGEYKKLVYCNKDDTNLATGGTTYKAKCQASYDALGDVTNELEIECDWHFYEPSFLVKWFIDWTALPRLTVKGNLPMEEYLGLEVGDLVDLVLPARYKPTTVPDDSLFIVTETRIDIEKGKIFVQFVEVKDPS